MPELSREAMQLMELSPVWRLRGSAPASTQQDFVREGFMIMAIARDAAAQRLWQAIGKSMAGMGYDSTAVHRAVILPSLISDRIASELQQRPPKALLVFGQEIADTVRHSLGEALSEVSFIELPSLQAMAAKAGSANQSPGSFDASPGSAKRKAWSLLVAHKGLL